MKKLLLIGAIIALAGGVFAQTNDYTIRQVRDPVQFRAELNGDLYATDTRLDALEASTNVNGQGLFASITAGTVAIQTNATIGGTLGVTGASALPSATIGEATVQTNLTVSGRITAVTINQATVSTNLTVSGTATLTGGIVGGASSTNVFYTVAAGTANCITNTVVTRSGIVTTATTQ